MLVVFGPISMELHIPSNAAPVADTTTKAGDYTLNAGGRGANQAFAAARSGAKVALIGKTGDDDYAKRILDKVRGEGVITSGVGRSETNHTGLDIICTAKDGSITTIVSPGANQESSAEQVPENILADNAYLLIQTQLPMQENISLLEKAKAQGATTILNLAPSIELSMPMLDKLDYLIVNQTEATKFAEKLGLPQAEQVEKIAKALAALGGLTCIITMGENGAISYDNTGKGWRVPTIKIDKLVDRNGIEDVYCGTLAACLQADMPLNQAMKRAGLAASLSYTKEGGQSSFPYLSDIEAQLDELPETQSL